MRPKTLAQKAEATTRLLMGMRLAEVTTALAPYGFCPQVIDDGFARLRALVAARSEVPVPKPERGATFSELEGDYTRWLAITRRVLAPYPALRGALVHGLGHSRGAPVVIALSLLLDRLDSLERGEAPFGPVSTEVTALLTARGLDGDERQRLRARIDGLCKIIDLGPARAAREREEEALEHLWNWYQEWSLLAHKAVTSHPARLALGFPSKARERDDAGVARERD
ncbi:MAG TPA: hypothetical protein VLC09_02795 [Polyangiaceae bacterium]|nr:hypothetical protein [Polyangiaceae bacterium]